MVAVGAVVLITVTTAGAGTPAALAVTSSATSAAGGTAAASSAVAASGAISTAAATTGAATAAASAPAALATTSTVAEIGTTALSAAPGLLTNPLGWAILGVDQNSSPGRYTFDCWKPILHDLSLLPSKGKLLKDVVADPRIKHVEITSGAASSLPKIVLHNIWDEKYRIDFLHIYSNQLAAHAVKL